MLAGDQAIKILSALNDSSSGHLFRSIAQKPGIDAGTLRKDFHDNRSTVLCMKNLESSGLVTAVKDGRHHRYFPAPSIKDQAKSEMTKMKAFRSALIKRIEAEHLMPEITELKGSSMIILLRYFLRHQDSVIKLEIPYNPFETTLASILINK